MGHISLHDVSFVLPDGRVLLHEVSFRVGEGAKMALVGANGTGKTTVASQVRCKSADEGSLWLAG